MAGVVGIEPTPKVLETFVLPLNYTPPKMSKKKMEEEEGFEPPRGMTRLSVFKTDPFSQTWVFLQK
jgi:hypothetical protein